MYMISCNGLTVSLCSRPVSGEAVLRISIGVKSIIVLCHELKIFIVAKSSGMG